MDPLTPLTHIEFTRDRNRLLERVQAFQGRRGELFPVRSAAEEAQQSSRNVWEIRAGVTLDALNAIATRLGGLREGRKSILFVSQGPPVGLRSSNWSRMEDVVQSANRGNVTIHTLDPRPLGTVGFGGNMVLRHFADETGGRAIFNTNDHAEHLDEVIGDASAYYLVAYAPPRELADGRFHKIGVEVKRRGVRVAARRGYWAPRAEELNAPPAEPVARGVMTALTSLVAPRTGRTAEVWIGYARGEAGRTSVLVTWDPIARLGQLSAGRLEIEQLGPDGAPGGPGQLLARRDDADGRALARFDLNPGKATLRLTSYDTSGELLDRWPEDITVPALAASPLALATPRFFVARTAFELRMVQSQASAPVATRRFRKTDRLLVELESYSTAGEPELVAALLNQRGEELVTLPLPAGTAKGSRFEIPLQSLAPAVYILRIQARAGGHQVEEHAPFRLVP
jgi:hypothetical protein